MSESDISAIPTNECIDVHCHVIENESNLSEIEELDVRQLWIMGTRPQDWELVRKVAESHTDKVVPCFGKKVDIEFCIHPWFSSRLTEQDSNWMTRLETYLDTFPNSILGEIGLDGVARDLNTNTIYPLEPQWDLFRLQMDIASRKKKCVSIHSVQVHGKVLDYFQKMNQTCIKMKKDARRNREGFDESMYPCPPAIMMHSFSGSHEIGQALTNLSVIGSRFYFSFSHLVNARSPKVEKRIEWVPEDRILIESDVHDTVHVKENLQRVVEMVSRAGQWSIPDTIARTRRNAERFLALTMRR